MLEIRRDRCAGAILRMIALGLLLVLSATSARCRSALAYDLMLDASGSMSGFPRASKATWNAMISSLESKAGRRWSFGSRVTPVRGSLTKVALGQGTTNLGKALEAWLDESAPSDALVILTDNVTDEGFGKATESLEKFYQLLTRDRRLGNIAVIPFRLPFRGLVYHPNDDSRNAWYVGPRALAIYLIARSDFNQDELGRLRGSILATLGRIGGEGRRPAYIQIRPFAKEGWSQETSQTNLNVGVVGEHATRVRISDEGIALLGFDVGEEIDFTINATVHPGPDFRLVDAELSPSMRFEDVPLLNGAEVLKVEVTPRQATLEPEYAQPFVVDFRISAFALPDLDFITRLELALKGQTWVNGELTISYAVERRNINLAGEASEEWDYSGDIDRLATPDPEVQGRIYRLNTLVQRMIPNSELRKQIWARPVWVQLAYPANPIFLLILLAVLAMVCLASAAYWFARRGADYSVIDDVGTMHRIKAPFGTSVVVPSSDNATNVRIRNFGFFHLHSSSDRLRSPRMASTGRAVAIVESRGENSEQYRFTIESMKDKDPSVGEDDDRI